MTTNVTIRNIEFVVLAVVLCFIGFTAYACADDLQTAENVLLYQRETGGWPKNYERKQAASSGHMSGGVYAPQAMLTVLEASLLPEDAHIHVASGIGLDPRKGAIVIDGPSNDAIRSALPSDQDDAEEESVPGE